MKILVIENYNPFAVSGASANRWRTLIEGLEKQGAEMHLLIVQGYQTKAEYSKYKQSGFIGKINIYYTIFLLHSTLWWSRLSDYILSPILRGINIRQTRLVINKVNPDILFLHPSTEVFSIYKSIFHDNKTNFKLMIELGEFNDIHLTENNTTNRLQLSRANKYNQLLINYILPKVDILLTITRKLANHYQNISKNEKAIYYHLPMTVDLSRFLNVQSTILTKPYIAYIGVLNNKKDGIDILIKAFAKISLQFPAYNLILVGSPHPDTAGQKELVANLNLQNKVIFTGGVHRDNVPALLSNAEVLVLPRPDSHQAQGGFPTKLGEYLATGNPVCVTKVGEIPDHLTDNESAFMAEPGNVDSFADALIRALSDKSNATRVGLNGKKIATEQFNMEIQAKNLFTLLQKITGKC